MHRLEDDGGRRRRLDVTHGRTVMRGWIVGRVAAKEVLSTVRDRRAIVSNLLIPLLLLPAMMLGLPLALGGLFGREQATMTEVAIRGAEALPAELRELLAGHNLELFDSADPELEVREGGSTLGIDVPSGMAERLDEGEQVELVVYGKAGNLRSEVAEAKIGQAVEAYRLQLVRSRLAAAGLDSALLEPVSTRTVDASSAAQRGVGQLSWIVPFFIAIWTLMGGQMAAIDATAGEKERGTLESLLVAPVRRTEVVAGKFVATLVFGLAAGIMAIAGYLLGGTVLLGVFAPRLPGDASRLVSAMQGSLHITLDAVLLLLVSALLLAGTVAALLLGITMFARSFKEAQSYVAPLGLVLILPAMALQFKDLLDFGLGIYLVPVLNALLLMDDAMRGTASGDAVAVTWLSLALVIAALLAFAYRSFRREDVIFRT